MNVDDLVKMFEDEHDSRNAGMGGNDRLSISRVQLRDVLVALKCLKRIKLTVDTTPGGDKAWSNLVSEIESDTPKVSRVHERSASSGTYSNASADPIDNVSYEEIMEKLRRAQEEMMREAFYGGAAGLGGLGGFGGGPKASPPPNYGGSFSDFAERTYRRHRRQPPPPPPPPGAKKRWFEVLNVQPGASRTEIRKAYRHLAMKYHPDREGGSAEMMRELNMARDEGLGGLPK